MYEPKHQQQRKHPKLAKALIPFLIVFTVLLICITLGAFFIGLAILFASLFSLQLWVALLIGCGVYLTLLILAIVFDNLYSKWEN